MRVSFSGRAKDENADATGAPEITGTAKVRETLTADAGTITDLNGLPVWPGDFTFQWVRVEAGTESDIADATEQTYTLAQEDRGKKIKVAVSFTDNEGYDESRTSALYPKRGTIAPDTSGPVPVSAKVLANGTQIELAFDEVLASATEALAPTTAFTVEVGEEDFTVSEVTPVAGTKTLIVVLEERTIVRGEIVRVSYTDPSADNDDAAIQDADGFDTASFTALGAVNESTQIAKPGKPTGLTAIANGETRIDISWIAPVQTGGRPISGYKIEVYDLETETWTTLVASQEAIAYSDTGLSPGTARHYRVFAITAAGTSKPSETASATTTPTPTHAHCAIRDG